MTTVNIYLNFNGNCEEAFNFYKSIFGGDFTYLGRFEKVPESEGMPPMPDSMKNKILHIALPISKETVLMGSDIGGEWAPEFRQGTNFSISANTDNKAEADRIFAGLSIGGIITMPMAIAFWGDYFGMCTDKFGVNWMVNFNQGNG